MSVERDKAVFLGTEAAKRICKALRAAVIEVWFDQSELAGGVAGRNQFRSHGGKALSEAASF